MPTSSGLPPGTVAAVSDNPRTTTRARQIEALVLIMRGIIAPGRSPHGPSRADVVHADRAGDIGRFPRDPGAAPGRRRPRRHLELRDDDAARAAAGPGGEAGAYAGR